MKNVKDMTDVELSQQRSILTRTTAERVRRWSGGTYGISAKNLRKLAPVVKELVARGYGPCDQIAESPRGVTGS